MLFHFQLQKRFNLTSFCDLHSPIVKVKPLLLACYNVLLCSVHSPGRKSEEKRFIQNTFMNMNVATNTNIPSSPNSAYVRNPHEFWLTMFSLFAVFVIPVTLPCIVVSSDASVVCNTQQRYVYALHSCTQARINVTHSKAQHTFFSFFKRSCVELLVFLRSDVS
jgi:hypothetical protein